MATGAAQVRPGLRRWLRGLLRTGRVWALLLALAAAWAGYTALTSPRFVVQSVRAVGNQALSGADVAAFAQVAGQSIWFVEPAVIAARVGESPYVEAATVRLQLPDAVVVTVRERQPDVRWLHDGRIFAVTNDGLVVDQQLASSPPVSPTLPLSPTVPLSASTELSTTVTATLLLTPTTVLPPSAAGLTFASEIMVVDTTPNRPIAVRDHVDPDAIRLAQNVSAQTTKWPLALPIQRIEWDAGMGVSLIVGDGRQVVLGRSNQLDRKLATLRALLSDGTTFKFLDLRPTTPYYR